LEIKEQGTAGGARIAWVLPNYSIVQTQNSEQTAEASTGVLCWPFLAICGVSGTSDSFCEPLDSQLVLLGLWALLGAGAGFKQVVRSLERSLSSGESVFPH
jgi:hypothetical protein